MRVLEGETEELRRRRRKRKREREGRGEDKTEQTAIAMKGTISRRQPNNRP